MGEDIDRMDAVVKFGFPGETVCKTCGVRMMEGRSEEHPHLSKFSFFIWEKDHMDSDCHRGFISIQEQTEKLKESLPALVKEYEESAKKRESRRDRSRRRSSSRSRRNSRSRGRQSGSRGRGRSRNAKRRDSRSRNKERGDTDRSQGGG